jgi:hypothetical protein
MLAQQIAAGDMRNAEPRGEPLACVPLPAPGAPISSSRI